MHILPSDHLWLRWLTIKHRTLGHIIFLIATALFVVAVTLFLNLNPLTVSKHTLANPIASQKLDASLVQDHEHLLTSQTKQLIINQDQQYQKTALKPRISVATTTLSADTSDKDLAGDGEAKGSSILNHPITSSGGIGGYNGILIVIFKVGTDYHGAVIVRPFIRGVLSNDWVQNLVSSNQGLLELGTKQSLNQFVTSVNTALVNQLQQHYFHQTTEDRNNLSQLKWMMIICGSIMGIWLILNWLMMTNLTVDAYGNLMYQKHSHLSGKNNVGVMDDSDVFLTGLMIGAIKPIENVYHDSSSSGGGGGFSGGGGGFSGGDGGGFA